MRILAFDVSETLQTGAEHNDGGRGQPMMFGDEVIPGAFSILNGGVETAQLLKDAQEAGLRLVLVTNNGGEARARTLDFLQRYGVTLREEDYYEPPVTTDGMASKVDRLDLICKKYEIAKEQIRFFDDSRANVEEAQAAGYVAIRVKSAADLQNGIRQALEQKAAVDAREVAVAAEVGADADATAEEERPETAAVAVAEIDLEQEDNRWLQQRQWLTAQQHVESAEAALTACRAAYGQRWPGTAGMMLMNLQLFGQSREFYGDGQSVRSEFLPNLYIGSLAAMVAHYDEGQGSGHLPKYDFIFDLSQEIQRKSSGGWITTLDAARHVTINVGDTGENFDDIVSSLREQLPRIQETRQRGGQVLINCAAGQSRSATAAALYLMLTYNIGAVEAIKYLQAYRHQVAPNPGYMAALIAYEKTHLQEVRPFDKAIARAFAEDFLNRYDVDTAKKAFTGAHDNQATTLAFQEEGENVVISADRNLAAQSCIDLLSLLKYLDIPFEWTVCTKHAASIQISADDFKKLKQCLRTKTLDNAASASALNIDGASEAMVAALTDVEFAAATSEVGSASEEEELPVFAAQYRITDANIYQKPTEIIPAAPTAQIVIGDLHGNFMKFLYFLVRHQVIDISEEHYSRLCELYRKPVEELTADDIAVFNGLLDALPIKQRPLVRLIGDELADRGQNDYFMLKLLQKLHESEVRVEINLSNHSIEFSQACAKYTEVERLIPPLLQGDHAMSLINLQRLLSKGLVTWDEVKAFNETVYQPMLRIIGYSLDTTSQPTSITLYSHAGMDFQAIEGLCHKFGVDFDASSAEALGQTIDAINVKVQQYLKEGQFEALVDPAVLYQGYDQRPIDPNTHPVEYLLWNRFYNLRRANGDVESGHGKGYDIRFVHGHDSSEVTQDNIYNLDNILGKTVRAYWDPQVIQRDISEAEHTEFVCAESTPVLSVTAQAAATPLMEAVASAPAQPQPAASMSAQATMGDATDAAVGLAEPQPVTEQIVDDSVSEEVTADEAVTPMVVAPSPEAEAEAGAHSQELSEAGGKALPCYLIPTLESVTITFAQNVLNESLGAFTKRFHDIGQRSKLPDHVRLVSGDKTFEQHGATLTINHLDKFYLECRWDLNKTLDVLREAASGVKPAAEADMGASLTSAAASMSAQATMGDATDAAVALAEPQPVTEQIVDDSVSEEVTADEAVTPVVVAPSPEAEGRGGVTACCKTFDGTSERIHFAPSLLTEGLPEFNRRFQAWLLQKGLTDGITLAVAGKLFINAPYKVDYLPIINHFHLVCRDSRNQAVAFEALKEAASGKMPAAEADMGASLTSAAAAPANEVEVISGSKAPLSMSAQAEHQRSEVVAVEEAVSAAETARSVGAAAIANTMHLEGRETADLGKQAQNRPLTFKVPLFSQDDVKIYDYDPGILTESPSSFEQRFQAILRQSGQPGSASLWVESSNFASDAQPIKTLSEIIEGRVNAPRIHWKDGMDNTTAVEALRRAARGERPAAVFIADAIAEEEAVSAAETARPVGAAADAAVGSGLEAAGNSMTVSMLATAAVSPSDERAEKAAAIESKMKTMWQDLIELMSPTDAETFVTWLASNPLFKEMYKKVYAHKLQLWIGEYDAGVIIQGAYGQARAIYKEDPFAEVPLEDADAAVISKLAVDEAAVASAETTPSLDDEAAAVDSAALPLEASATSANAPLRAQGESVSKNLFFKTLTGRSQKIEFAQHVLAESLGDFNERFQAILKRNNLQAAVNLIYCGKAFQDIGAERTIDGITTISQLVYQGIADDVVFAALQEAAAGVRLAAEVDATAETNNAAASPTSPTSPLQEEEPDTTDGMDSPALAGATMVNGIAVVDGNSALSLEPAEAEAHNSEVAPEVAAVHVRGAASPASPESPNAAVVDTGVFAGGVAEGAAYGVTTKPSLSNYLLVGVGMGLMCGGLAAVTVLTFGAALLPALILSLGSVGGITSGAALGATLGAGLGYLAHRQGFFAKPAHAVAQDSPTDLLLQQPTAAESSRME